MVAALPPGGEAGTAGRQVRLVLNMVFGRQLGTGFGSVGELKGGVCCRTAALPPGGEAWTAGWQVRVVLDSPAEL